MKVLLHLFFCNSFAVAIVFYNGENCYSGAKCSAYFSECKTGRLHVCKVGTAIKEGFGCSEQSFQECCLFPNVHPGAISFGNLSTSELYNLYGITFPLFTCLLKKHFVPRTTLSSGKSGFNCAINYRENGILKTCSIFNLYNSDSGECNLSYQHCCKDDAFSASNLNDFQKYFVVNLISSRMICPELSVLPKNHFNAAPMLIPSNIYNYGVEITTFASANIFECFKQQAYETVMIEAYTSFNNGSCNPFAYINKQQAEMTGLLTSFTVSLSMNGKSGKVQFDEMQIIFRESKIAHIWIKVMDVNQWSREVHQNIARIAEFVREADENGIMVGIYTNWYIWEMVADNFSGFYKLPLLYANIAGDGPNAETEPDFDDFEKFGNWEQPTVKRFAFSEDLCGLPVNRFVYHEI